MLVLIYRLLHTTGVARTRLSASRYGNYCTSDPPRLHQPRANRNYYPVFPPARGSMIDYSRREHLEMPCAPDLLLAPSKITPFAKLCTVPGDDTRVPGVEGSGAVSASTK